MTPETYNGLHKCKLKNTPQEGEVKNMIVEHKPATVKDGKPKKAWIKITNKKPEEGGTPYRILNVQKLDWPPDEHQNIAFNIEVEPAINNDFQKAKATMQRPDEDEIHKTMWEQEDAQRAAANAPGQPPAHPQVATPIDEARKHLCQAANLYNLCVKCVNSMIADELPAVARTSEQFQAAVGTLFIECSRSGFVSKMPTYPLNKNEN